MQRNYHELSPFDFECLVRDLLQAELGDRLEVFSPGRDGGVDVRLLSNHGHTLLVQCKHSPMGTYESIRAGLRTEAKRIHGKLQGEYWLATSASLTAANKDEISELFGVALLRPERILSRHDCDNLLNLHEHVEQRHYKLYLTSSAVLRRVVAGEIFFRRDSLLEELEDRIRLFVQTPAFNESLDLLARHGTCIISGEPGVGKTTLAEMILLRLAEDEFEPIVITDVRDAERMFSPDRKQVFYYDDFLGQNSIAEKLGRNEDDLLLRLIRRFSKKPGNHFFILTTREYILTQAKQTYERIRRSDVDIYKFVLDLQSYNKLHKAHILYNHIYYSKLSREAIVSVLNDRAYRTIIQHPNYSPRLIEMAIKFAGKQGDPADGAGFHLFLMRTLSNPSELWVDAFDSQFSDTDRDCVLALVSLLVSRSTTLEALEGAIRARAVASQHQVPDYIQIRRSLDVLNGVVIRISYRRFGNEPNVDTGTAEFANPSFVDFLFAYLGQNLGLVQEMLRGFIYFEQYQTLISWMKPRFYRGGFPHPAKLSARLSRDFDQIAAGMLSCISDPNTNPHEFPPYLTGSSKILNSPHGELLKRADVLLRFLAENYDLISRETSNAVIGALGEKWLPSSFWSSLSSHERATAKDSVLAVLEASGESDTAAVKLRDIVTVGIDANLREPQDYQSRAELMDPSSQEFADLRTEFEDFSAQYADDLLGFDDATILEAERDLLSSAVVYFEIDLDEALARIDEYLAELPAGDEYDGDDDRGWRTEDTVGDAEVDGLFDTLRD